MCAYAEGLATVQAAPAALSYQQSGPGASARWMVGQERAQTLLLQAGKDSLADMIDVCVIRVTFLDARSRHELKKLC